MKKLSILLLAADSGEGPLGEMIDPALRAAWAAEGLQVYATYFSDLREDELQHVHAVLLLRTPLPGHPLADHADYQAKLPWLRRFVEDGGGLFVFFTECYGKSESTLNELAEPWGLRFFFNRLTPAPGVPIERFPRFCEGAILPARFVENPVTRLRGDLGLITEGGHGTQHLTCVSDPAAPVRWMPILRGGPLLRSESYRDQYINTSADDIADPVLAAAAAIGRGRVVAFPGSAPFWIVNSHIWRFAGLLHAQRGDAGSAFLLDALRWLCDTPRGHRALAPTGALADRMADPARLLKPRLFSFQRVSEQDQLAARTPTPRKLWLGPHRVLDRDLQPLVASLTACGYAGIFPLEDYRLLREERWEDFLQAGRAVSTGQVTVVPGYELHDEEGVRSAVVSPQTFPKHVLHYPNSTLLENVWVPIAGCLSILRTPLNNRIPPQRYGGYNYLEWQEGEEWFRLYAQLVASKYFIAPLAINRTEGRDLLNTWALPPRGAPLFDQLRMNRHTTFVTEGPVLEVFAWEGPGLTDDDWEGLWYGYEPGDEAVVHLGVSAAAPLREVVLYDGEQVLHTFHPNAAHFTAKIRLTLWRDRALHVTAFDVEGRRLLATYPLYTRNLRFWGHVGSDQMNNYVNALEPSPRGFLGLRGELYDLFGFVTLGAGWGDYLRITPSIRYSDFMPRQEISLIVGSFNVHHPSALLREGDALRYLNDHRRFFSFCCADAQWFRSRIAGQHLENDAGLEQTWHGERVRPTRIFLPVVGADAVDDYVVWRWEANEPILVEVRKSFQVEPRLLADEWLTYASNTHHLLPGLQLRDAAGQTLRAADLPLSPGGAEPHKEWDNSHYLRGGAADPRALALPGPGDVEIGHGGAGTFGLFPLGPTRDYRVLLRRSERELTVFFQCRLARVERRSGFFQIDYLLAVDATESPGSPFSPLRRHLERASAGCKQRRLSVPLELNGHLPPQLDLDDLYPALKGHPLWLEIRGLPPGATAWRDTGGRLLFASQPMNGRSFHRLAGDGPRLLRPEPATHVHVGSEA